MPAELANLILSYPQKKHESQYREMRRLLIQQDKKEVNLLAFSGKFE